MPNRKRSAGVLAAIIVVTMLVSTFAVGTAHATATTITAYKSTIAVNVKDAYSASEWTDTPTITEPISGLSFAVKQNGTGWLFLMMWQTNPAVCSDSFCFGGIELNSLSNTGEMGTPTTPSIMILASSYFQNSVGHTTDEFISTADQTPISVESLGYATQSVCGALTLTGSVTSGTYTVQCYRPFALKNASPYDFPTLGVGSTLEIGFAVGEFSNPGDHDATSMIGYVLTFSGSTYSPSSTTSSTSSSSTSTTSTTPTTTTTSSTTSTTSTTPTTTTTSSTTSTKSTTPTTTTITTSTTSTTPTTTTTTTTTSKSTTPTTTTTATTATSSGPAYTVKVTTNAASYQNVQTGLITVTITPNPGAGTMVQLAIMNPYGTPLFTDAAPVSAAGTASANFTTGSPYWEWVGGTYSVNASWSPTSSAAPFLGVAQFTYSGSAPSTTTTTSTSSAVTVTTTAPPTTKTVTSTQSVVSTESVTSTQSVTGPTTTTTATTTAVVTSTQTSTATAPPSTVTSTSTVTQTTSSIPGWAYAVMAVLLILGLAIGYVVKNVVASRPAATGAS